MGRTSPICTVAVIANNCENVLPKNKNGSLHHHFDKRNSKCKKAVRGRQPA